MGTHFIPTSLRNLRILDYFGRGKSEAEIARLLKLKGSGSISRTKDNMLHWVDPRLGYETPLIEEVHYSSGKQFRLTARGTQLLLENIKVLENFENSRFEKHDVKPSNDVKTDDKVSRNTAPPFNHGRLDERGEGQSVKPSRYDSQIWRLHARKRVFKLATKLEESDLTKIYHGFASKYRVILNGSNRPEGKRLKGQVQLTGDYRDQWQDGDILYLKVSWRIISSMKGSTFTLYGPQVERPWGYGSVHDLEELHEEQVEQIIPQIEQDIRSFLPKFRIMRSGQFHSFIVGSTDAVGELAETSDGFSKHSREPVHVIENSHKEPALSFDRSKEAKFEIEGIHKTEAVNYMEKIDNLLRRVIEDGPVDPEAQKTAVLGIQMIKELIGALHTSQDQHNQLRDDVNALVRFVNPGGYGP